MLAKILASRVTAQDFSLTSLGSRALESLGLLTLKGEAGSDEAAKFLGIAAHAESYSLELANYPEASREIEVLIPPRADSFFRLTVGPNSTAHPDRWLRAFYLTLMWWQPALIETVLLNIRYEVLQASSTKSPAYRYLQVEAAKALYRDAPDAPEKILETLEAMAHLPGDSQEFAAFIAMHECGMMAKLALRDEAGFNQEVELALASHVKFYCEGETRRNGPEAWLCLPALGLAALAKRRGMSVTVQSPYLPHALL
ncbi:Imm49 family immunity protein [Deinococcus cavernae]|nr:Imm49 family immunity protein [Deinococcus cavernae]